MNEKNDIVEWAKKLFAKDFCILDTETTGLDYDSEVVEIAIIDKSGKILINQLIKPSIKIPEDVIAIHGINNKEVRNAPIFKKVWPSIGRILKEQNQIVVYNVDFDKRIIEQSCDKYEIESELERFNWVCAMSAYAKFHGEWNDYRGNWKWQKLITATRWATNYLKCDHYGTHRALNDCKNTLLVLKALAQYEGIQKDSNDKDFDECVPF
jgi:DNA polymerase-3 subunit epsilon